MGGHGGLNILHQKKWNVYNYDNRAIVDKDKKQAARKKRESHEESRKNGLQGKLDVLKQERGIPQSEPLEEKQHSLITQELTKMNEKSKHINLFEKEQKIIENRQIQQIKRLHETEFLKGKDDLDLSSKFLGTYTDEKKKPWYIKNKGEPQGKKEEKSHWRNHEKSKQKKDAVDEDRQRSREKGYEKKKPERSEMEILRQKRLRREEKEREKIRKLKLAKEK